jgi:hypothetical protein
MGFKKIETKPRSDKLVEYIPHFYGMCGSPSEAGLNFEHESKITMTLFYFSYFLFYFYF